MLALEELWVLSDTVEYYDGIVDRVTYYCKDTCDERVVDSDPEKAKIIADSFIEVGAKYIVEKLPGAYASPLQYAKNGHKNYPQPVTYAIYAFVLAAAVTVLILIVISMFDRSIKNEDDFKSSYKYPVLGVVPDYADAAKGDK